MSKAGYCPQSSTGKCKCEMLQSPWNAVGKEGAHTQWSGSMSHRLSSKSYHLQVGPALIQIILQGMSQESAHTKRKLFNQLMSNLCTGDGSWAERPKLMSRAPSKVLQASPSSKDRPKLLPTERRQNKLKPDMIKVNSLNLNLDFISKFYQWISYRQYSAAK